MGGRYVCIIPVVKYSSAEWTHALKIKMQPFDGFYSYKNDDLPKIGSHFTEKTQINAKHSG